MGHQRGHHRDEERVIAGSLQLLRPASGCDPSGGSQKQEDLLVRAPGQPPRDHLAALWLVLRATVRAISTSGFVGLTLTRAINSSRRCLGRTSFKWFVTINSGA